MARILATIIVATVAVIVALAAASAPSALASGATSGMDVAILATFGAWFAVKCAPLAVQAWRA